MNKIAPVIIAAIVKDKKFLMTKRIHLDPEDYKSYHNAWQLPGGGMNFEETPEEALHREIKEELGVKIKIIRFVPKIYTEVRKYWQGLFLVYVCKLVNEDAKIILDKEASEYGWYTIEEAKKMKSLPGTIEIMKDSF